MKRGDSHRMGRAVSSFLPRTEKSTRDSPSDLERLHHELRINQEHPAHSELPLFKLLDQLLHDGQVGVELNLTCRGSTGQQSDQVTVSTCTQMLQRWRKSGKGTAAACLQCVQPSVQAPVLKEKDARSCYTSRCFALSSVVLRTELQLVPARQVCVTLHSLRLCSVQLFLISVGICIVPELRCFDLCICMSCVCRCRWRPEQGGRAEVTEVAGI